MIRGINSFISQSQPEARLVKNAVVTSVGNALYPASERGHEKIVQMLLDKVSDVNAKGEYGGALCSITGWFHEKVVQFSVDVRSFV